jgi:hypothetical protein
VKKRGVAPQNQSLFRWISTQYVFLWGMFTLLIVILFAGLGIYAKRYMSREFIGEQTRLVQECRANPKSKGKVCEDLLIARGAIEQSKYSKTMRSPQRPPFLLSDGDADLTPVPK